MVADARSGVIVITSKKAKAGETYISVDHNTVASNVSRLHPYQNEYGGGYDQAWDTFAYNPATDPASWAAFNGQNIPYYAADESWGPKIRWYFGSSLGFMDSKSSKLWRTKRMVSKSKQH